jgi:hypothetical protein
MDILSDYRITSHWANDESALDLAAERARHAEEREPDQPAAELPRRHGLVAGRIFHRTRNA